MAAPWAPAGFIERIGAALLAPRQALAAADAPQASGKAGSDAAWLIALAFLVTHTREVVLSVWLFAVEGLMVGLTTLMGSLGRAVTMDLAFLFVAGIALTILAGSKRAVNRDFDLACVAYVPIAALDMAATLLLRLLPRGSAGPLAQSVGQSIHELVSPLAYGWALAVLVLAWRLARSRGASPTPAATPEAAPAHTSVSTRARTRSRWAGRALLGIAAALLAVQSLWLARNLGSLEPVTSGDRAPPLALRAIDARGAMSPQLARLDHLHGQVVLLDFWATWCGPCVDSLPAIERVHRRYQDQGLMVLSINSDDAHKARALLRSLGATLPLFADDGTTADRYRVSTIPHLVLVDRHGIIRHVHRGIADEAELDQHVRALLAPPPT